MEYRDQLKYIKSHPAGGQGKRPDRRRKPSRRQEHLSGQRSDKYSKRRRDRRTDRYEEKGRKRYRQEEDRLYRVGAVNRLLWNVQLLASVFLFGSMAVLGILPMKYMAGLLLFLAVLLLIVKGMQRKAARSRKKKSSGKGLSLAASVILVVLGLYSLKVNAALDKIAVGEESGNYKEEHALYVTEQPFNVYISGIDVYGEITKESRSDVNLIATVNPEKHKILLTTTPRDYYVTIPGVSGDQKDKLTHAGIYGIDTSIATLENLYGIDIPFYVRVNFTSVEEIVDVLGGVDVESELAFTTGEEAGAIVEVKEGKNHFNGKEALAFVRERKALKTGDNQRGKNQQALLTGLIRETMSLKILLHANSMINSVAGNADTNMSERQMKALIRMQLGDLKGWEIESVAAAGDDTGKKRCYSYSGGPLYVTVPDEGSVEEIKGKMRENM